MEEGGVLTGGRACERPISVAYVLGVTSLATFLSGFNARLAVVGIAVILSSLSTDLWRMVWVLQGYMLGSTVTQLVGGRTSDAYGRSRLFLLGLTLFTIGAFLSGVSSSAEALALSRAVQGVGGGFIMSISVAMITDYVSSRKLATWLGLNQMLWRFGALIGLATSGYLIDRLGWRSLFLVQVPIGMAALFLARRGLPRDAGTGNDGLRELAPSLAASTVLLATILLGLTMIGYGYLFLGVGFLLASAIPFAAFVVLERRSKSPMLDPELLRNRAFMNSVIAQLAYSVGFGASPVLLSILYESVHGLSPTQTGLRLFPFELTFLVSGVLGGVIADRVGSAYVATLGLGVSSSALALLSREWVLKDVGLVTAVSALFGVGTGLFVAPNTSAIMSAAPADRRGLASSIRSLSFNVGFLLSLNVAALTMSSYVPYAEITTALARRAAAVGVGEGGLIHAVSRAFAVLSLFMALGIPLSMTRLKYAGSLLRPPRTP